MRGKKVVVVNDEEDILRLVADRLEFYGLEVRTARDGRDGVERVEQERPDLVLLDVWMPGMDGLEALAVIRANYPQLPVLMVSASAEQEVVEECLKQGATDYLIKPFEPAELQGKVFKLLGEER